MEAADTTSTGSGIDFDTPFALEYQIYNSTGIRSVWKFNYQNHNPVSHNSDNIVPMRWYVEDYHVRSLWDSITTTIGRIFGG
jgi:hypothetical protein